MLILRYPSSEPSCAPVPTEMHCARRVGLLGTPGAPQVCSPQCRQLLLCNGFCKLLAVIYPPKATCGEILTHSPTIEFVRVKIEDVATRLFLVVALEQRIVGFGMAL